MLKALIGLVIPFVGVIGLLPWAASVDTSILGVPFVYAWMFAWFFITSGCLLTCWKLFDRDSEDSKDAHP